MVVLFAKIQYHREMLDNLVSIAPMMNCTDRHYRYLVRLINPHVTLYTEMLHANAVIHGNAEQLLAYDAAEHPLVLQLGGSDPARLAAAASIGEAYGYDAVNLNIGCPSDRVQAGEFGACLMKRPALVADCIAAMVAAVSIPVTIKTRIGVDDCDSYEALVQFVMVTAAAGCKTFIIHARKAWLQGLSPRENRDIPPLRYETVYRLKSDFPDLQIVINGGIKTVPEMQQHLQHVDGVMIGREAYSNPALLDFSGRVSMEDVVLAYLSYVDRPWPSGITAHALCRPLLGLFKGRTGSRAWRAALSASCGTATDRIQIGLRYIISN